MKGRISQVTFKDFARLAQKRGWTVADLVDLIDGGIEDARNFFERVLSCRVKNREGRYEDRSNVAIPYRSVLRFYFKNQSPEVRGAPRPSSANVDLMGVGDTIAPQIEATR